MEIKTKFNLDDIIWVIDSKKVEEICPICEGKGLIGIKNETFACPKCHTNGKINEKDEWFVKGQIKITDIRVWCLYIPEIRYLDEKFNGNGIMVYEEDCFATEEQAQKECDRRNGKI